MARRRLLLFSGSLRHRSINSAVLRTAQVVAPNGTTAALYEGLGELPHYNPDDDTDQPPEVVVELRRAIRGADALLFSVPEYAGALPGSFKNLLDWTIGDDQPGSIYEKPVAWINASPRGAVDAHASLRTVLGYAHASVVGSACTDIPVTSAMVGADGLVSDSSTRDRIRKAIVELVRHIDDRSAEQAPRLAAGAKRNG